MAIWRDLLSPSLFVITGFLSFVGGIIIHIFDGGMFFRRVSRFSICIFWVGVGKMRNRGKGVYLGRTPCYALRWKCRWDWFPCARRSLRIILYTLKICFVDFAGDDIRTARHASFRPIAEQDYYIH
jgi:hypothetical protein